MNINEPPDPRSSMWNWIAYYVRFLRMQRGESGDVLAKRLTCARSSISRLENGEAHLAPDQADKLDEAWNTGGLFGLMVYYATLGHEPEWFKNFLAFEARAIRMKIYEALVIHGLLQTPDYARACLKAGGLEEVDKAVELRMARQKSLTTGRTKLSVLLKQSALEDPIGGPEVARAQLDHLIEMSRLPSLVLRVVPRSVGAHIGLDGSFSLITTDKGSAAYMEAVGGGRLSVDADEIVRFSDRFDQIGADALPREASRDLIAQVKEGM